MKSKKLVFGLKICCFFMSLLLQKINAQTINIGHAADYALLAADSIISNDSIYGAGKVGARNPVDYSFFIGFDQDSTFYSQAITDLQGFISSTNNIIGANLNVNLDGLSISPGVYTINGNALLNNYFTMNADSVDSVFVIKINGDLKFNDRATCINEAIKGENIIWIVNGEISFESDVTARGIFISTGNINLKSNKGPASFLTEGKIFIESEQLNYQFSSTAISMYNFQNPGPQSGQCNPLYFNGCERVVNGGFESFLQCPFYTTVNPGEFSQVCFWTSPAWGSPDLHNICHQFATISSHTGNTHAGWWAGRGTLANNTYREYIQNVLFQPLIANKIYHFVFYIAGADFATGHNFQDRIGITFLPNPLIPIPNQNQLLLTPTYETPPGDIINNRTSWRKISGYFKAQGGEKALLIGSFSPYSAIQLEDPSNNNEIAYYYTDDISVKELNLSVEINQPDCIGPYILSVTDPCNPDLINDASLTYSWNPTIGLSTSTGSPVQATPTINTIYTVTATTSNGITISATISVPGGSYLTSNSGTYNNRILYLDQDIDVIGTMSLNHVELRINSGYKITVKNGSILYIDYSLLKACLHMWKGIVVENGGTVKIMNHSTIQDAEYGVTVNDHANFSCSDSYFNDNYVGIFIPPNSIQNIISNFGVFATSFSGTGSLKAGYIGQTTTPGQYPYSGIEVNDVNLNIDGMSGLNLFSYLNNGMILKKSQISVINSRFKSIRNYDNYTSNDGSGIYCEGTLTNFSSLVQRGMTTLINSFEDSDKGIFAVQSDLDIRDNYMSDMNDGIDIEMADNSKIDIHSNNLNCFHNGIYLHLIDRIIHLGIVDNTINFGDPTGFPSHGIFVENTNTGSGWDNRITFNHIFFKPGSLGAEAGIWLRAANYFMVNINDIHKMDNANNNYGMMLDGCIKANVNCNTIIGSGNNYSNSLESGIYSFMGADPVYSCNTFDGTFNGLYFAGPSGTNTDIKGNKFYSHVYGVFLDAFNSVGRSDWKGNLWYQQSILGGKNANNLDQNASLNQWNVDPNTCVVGGASPIPFSWYPLNWIVPNSGVNYDCGACINHDVCDQFVPYFSTNYYDNLDVMVATGQISIQQYEEEINLMLKKRLFEKLTDNPNLKDSLVQFEQFYDSLKTLAIGKLDEIRKGEDEILKFSPSLLGSIDQKRVQIDLNLELLKQKYIEIEDSGLTNSQKALIMNEISGITNLIVEATSFINTGLELKTIENAILIDSLLLLNSASFNNSALIEENQKKVNDIYLKTIAKGNRAFSEMQVADLLFVANQCPLSGGNSVFIARSMYSLFENNFNYDDQSTCLTEGMVLRKKSESSLFTILTTPNPASDLATLKINAGFQKPLKFVICDVVGRDVESFDIKALQTSINFSTSKLNSGLYFCQLIDDYSVIGMSRLIVQH